jgi:hypothetical protein
MAITHYDDRSLQEIKDELGCTSQDEINTIEVLMLLCERIHKLEKQIENTNYYEKGGRM